MQNYSEIVANGLDWWTKSWLASFGLEVSNEVEPKHEPEDTIKKARRITQYVIDRYDPERWNCQSFRCGFIDCDYCPFNDMHMGEGNFAVHKIIPWVQR